ncbi:MAG: DNA primase [Clostridia bacterium]|nr:DNA primase [Clostridia bacterium]
MAQGLTPEFLEELKFKCDIVEVISTYVPLQKKGGRYFGCCPFHNEKTASFCVNQQSAYYHCFGCGASGDVVKFVQEIESVSFVDAVKILAEKANMPMPEFKLDPHYQEKKDRKDVLKQLMRDAARYFRNNLLDETKGREAREYLASRGINDETAKRYGLGLSVDFDSMPAYLRRKGYKLQDLYDCGLVNNIQNPRDAFGNRIIVPIMNGMSEVVAFGGRIFHGETDVAKYKNSTNTTLFDKGRTLYGVNFVKRDKKENGAAYKSLVLVEGYMDVISLGAVGVKNAVAGMGTALTEGQARELKRLVDDVYVCYDGDNAGRHATVKNVEPLLEAGLNVKVISLDDGKDPDETVREGGEEAFIEKMKAALPVIEYKLKLCEDAFDLNTVDGRAKYINAAIRVLKGVGSRAEREVYFERVSSLSRVSISTLEEMLSSGVKAKEEKPKADAEKKENTALDSSRFVINRIMENAKCANLDLVKREWLAHPKHQEIFDYAKSLGDEPFSVGKMYSRVADDPEINQILNINIELNTTQEKGYFEDCLVLLANEYIQGRLEYLKNAYNAMSDQNEKRNAVQEIAVLGKKLKSKSISEKL